MANCENTIMQEIENKQCGRLDIAKLYWLALRCNDDIDWRRINSAILERWSYSALEWIKRQAWSGKCFSEKEQ